MKPNARAARTAATLFIAATVAALLSSALLDPVLHSSDYLTMASTSQVQMATGALLQLIAGMTSAGIAMALYPVLRRHGEALALGSVGLRLMEGMLYIVAAVSALSLVTLSQESAHGTPHPSSVKASGALLLALRDRAGLAGILAFYLGATMYYYLFFRSRLIPRWLSGWGIIGTTLGLTAALLDLFGITSHMSMLQVTLNVPIFVNELILAVWLIVKGFDSSAGRSGLPAQEHARTLSG